VLAVSFRARQIKPIADASLPWIAPRGAKGEVQTAYACSIAATRAGQGPRYAKEVGRQGT
jgi:hypothetical protein